MTQPGFWRCGIVNGAHRGSIFVHHLVFPFFFRYLLRVKPLATQHLPYNPLKIEGIICHSLSPSESFRNQLAPSVTLYRHLISSTPAILCCHVRLRAVLQSLYLITCTQVIYTSKSSPVSVIFLTVETATTLIAGMMHSHFYYLQQPGSSFCPTIAQMPLHCASHCTGRPFTLECTLNSYP